MFCTYPSWIGFSIQLQLGILSFLDIFLEKVIIQNVRNALQQVRINGSIGIHLIQMVGCAGNLSGEPNRGSALLLQHGFYPLAYMYFPDFRHKNSVESYFLLEVQGFHAPLV